MSKRAITVIPGDGIGPSIIDATLELLKAVGCEFDYIFTDAGTAAYEKTGELLPEKTLDLIRQHGLALKGPIMTPVGGGFTSMNVTLRKTFDLYANVRPAISFEGTKSRFENVDILTIRENTEGMYAGVGQKRADDDGSAEAMSVITRSGAERIVTFAYELAVREGRKKVTAMHKANILKSTSGLFLDVAREVAARYPQIESEEMIIDAACMNLVMYPERFDVIVTTNLFGDIISDLCAGLIGGLGMAPGANIGQDIAIFEAVHGSAPDIAGQNIANPTSVFLAAVQMLEYLQMNEPAQRILKAVRTTIASGQNVTKDLGGSATTTEYTKAVIGAL